MKIGFLGLGNMGTPMALRLLAAGHELSVWNRGEARTKPLIREGAIAAATPAEAELGADAVITMLFDDAAYEEVFFGVHRMIDALSPGALHISCSTISVALSERLTAEYANRGIDFVAAPVFGRPSVAEEGRLWVVAAGADEAVSRARPLLEAFSRGISVVGKEPSQAHAVKLGGNFLISAMIHSLAEAFVFATGQGLEPETFFEAVNHALFQSPFYAAYAKIMLHPPEQIGATIELGAKDLRLLREAAASRQTPDASEPSRSDGGNLCRSTAPRASRPRLGGGPIPDGSAAWSREASEQFTVSKTYCESGFGDRVEMPCDTAFGV